MVETVFVCRRAGTHILTQQFNTLPELTSLVRNELDQLRKAGMKPTEGDIRCIVYGHLTRKAIQSLHDDWDVTILPGTRLRTVKDMIDSFGETRPMIAFLADQMKIDCDSTIASNPLFEGLADAVSF